MRTPSRFSMPLLLSVPCLFGVAQAQEIPEFNKLRTPTSPAFTILGVTPAQVHRPTTPATFALAFLQDFSNGDGFVPKNFAIETTPYWWFNHPELTLSEYEHAGSRNLYRNLSLSVATTADTPDENGESSRNVGIGLRTSIVSGKTVSRDCINHLQRLATQVSESVANKISASIAQDPALASDTDSLEQLRRQFFHEAPERGRLEAETKSCIADLSARQGFVLDLSTGVAFRFAEGEANAGDVTKAGLWITPAYLQGAFSGLGVFRALWEHLDNPDSEPGIDVGVRTVYSRSRYATSLETVWRHLGNSEDENLYRIAAIIDMKIAGDTWASVSFGRDFRGDEPGSLITLANIQWSMGDRTVRP